MADIIVTRTEPGARATAARLSTLGHRARLVPLGLIEPVMTDAALAGALNAAPAGAVLALTSANAARRLTGIGVDRARLIFAVGDSTADLARQAGFGDVESASGDVRALARLIAARSVGPVLHLRGEEAAGDLAGALADAGLACRALVIYRNAPAPDAPARARAAIRAGASVVLLHSPRGARRWIDAVGATTIAHIALSPAVAAPLREAAISDITIAERSDESSLFDALARRLERA